jgi:serine/threonine-protein kinase
MALLPRPGDLLEEYELIETIGVGGMGAVFRALDRRLDRASAVKVLPLEGEESGDTDVVQRFHQEGRAAARLDHEGIARVYALGQDRGFHFIAFEFIEGVNLRQLVEERGPLSVMEAINYTLQVAAALVHAAERRVVHRDIKPSNIIITPRGRAKLVDMGLARRFERGGADEGLTQSGMTLGSFDYISPEQARDPRDVDVRSDLYSLGCTMYHMLTGQPPFADGTVLQKLLQHQEEPPPDVRDKNPTVPAALASIVRKLMAKDRNRRYQSPEQLGHDLLVVASGMGLRVPGSDASTWAPVVTPTSSKRPWVWAAAAILMLAASVYGVVLGMGRDWGKQRGDQSLASNDVRSSPKGPDGPQPTPTRDREGTGTDQDQTPGPPRTYLITHGLELATALSEAPSGSTLELVGEGPFEVRRGLAVHDRDLLIKAASPDVRPVIRLARTPANRRGNEPSPPLLHFAGGWIILEGLVIDLDSNGREETVTGVLAEDADLTIQRCLFRRQAHWISAGRGIGLEVRGRRAQEEAPSVRVQTSAFEGALTAMLGRGPIDLRVSDCLFGQNTTSLRLDRSGPDRGPASTIDLRHVSVMAGDGPVFRFAGPAPRVRVENSVFAPPDDRPLTLVVADDPDRLDWSGRENLFSRVGTFLQGGSAESSTPPVRRFSAWADDPDGPREAGSIMVDAHIWAEPRPANSLADNDADRAFRLTVLDEGPAKVGARQGPTGPVPPPLMTASGRRPSRTESPNPGDADQSPTPDPTEPNTLARTETSPNGSATPAEPNPETSAPTRPMPMPMPRAVAEGGGPVNSHDEFLDEVQRLSPRGGTIVVAAGSILTLPTCEFRGGGQWTIKAEKKAGEGRPLIRFDPTIPGPDRSRTQSYIWRTLFRLRDRASLLVDGVDIVLPQVHTIFQSDRLWAAFGIATGTDLELIDCTVTVEGRTSPDPSAVVTVRPWDDDLDRDRDAADPMPAAREAKVRVSDSFFRAGDDFINVAAGRRLSLTAHNAAIALGGVMLRGFGMERMPMADPARLGVDLRQVTCWAGGGLISLKSTAGDSDLPIADITAKDTIVALSNPMMPLCKVQSHDGGDAAADPIRWVGQGVAYHGIEVFRIDQPANPSEPPIKQNRPEWRDAVGPRDEAPIFGDIKFVAPPRDQSPWTITRDQFRLQADTPAPRAGADPERLPTPPSSN